jgi:hypothetical protein
MVADVVTETHIFTNLNNAQLIIFTMFNSHNSFVHNFEKCATYSSIIVKIARLIFLIFNIARLIFHNFQHCETLVFTIFKSLLLIF